MILGSDETYGERMKLSSAPNRTEKFENGREGVRMTQNWLVGAGISSDWPGTGENRRSRSSARENDTNLSRNYSKDD